LSTTITIDNETRDQLLLVAADLQARQKRKVNYNDAIKYLIQRSSGRRLDVEKFKSACKQIPGADPKVLIESLYKERKHDDK
jgi:hypothetical protein